MSNPTLDGAVSVGFFSATHNASALALTTSDTDDFLVVITSAEPNNASAINVTGITNTGTASLSWTKYQAFTWADPSQISHTACIEVWSASAPLAGTYDITVTYNQTCDNACIVACGVNGATGWDAGVDQTATGSGTNPAVTGVSSAGGNLFVIAADSGGQSSMTFGAAPSNVTTTILQQIGELNGAEFNDLGTYYGTSSGGLSSQTITTNDTHSGGWGSKIWGMMVVALTSTPSGASATIEQTLSGVTQTVEAEVDAAGATIDQTLGGITQLAAAQQLSPAGNTTFTSSWSIGP